MNGNNTQTREGFISTLGHPRKKQLAEILFGESPTVEIIAAAGFDRITTLEMVREIKRNVQGMDTFDLDWSRKGNVVVSTPDVETPSENANTADTQNAGEGTGTTSEGEGTTDATYDAAVVGVDIAIEGSDKTIEIVIDTDTTPAAPDATVEDQVNNSAPAAPQV